MKFGLSTLFAAAAVDVLGLPLLNQANALHIEDWKTHNFDELDVCLYNGFLRTKKARDGNVETKASRFLKSSKGKSGLFHTSAATATAESITELSECVPDITNCNGAKRSYAFLVEELDGMGMQNGNFFCLKGSSDSADTDALHPSGTGSVELHVSCSDCYTDGFSDKGRWPSDVSDGYIVRFFVVDKCDDPSDRCSACGEKCSGNGSGKGKGSNARCGQVSPFDSSKSKSGSSKSKSGSSKSKSGSSKSKSGSSSSSGKASKSPSTSRAQPVSPCFGFYDDLCCIADGSCPISAAPSVSSAPSMGPMANTVTAPPTINVETAPPTGSPLPCPILCTDIDGTPEDKAAWFLENEGNPTEQDFIDANCAVPVEIVPCCYDWCDDEVVRPPSFFDVEECEAPPPGYDCAPSSAPSSPPTKSPTNPPTDPPTDPPTASPLPCPKWCGQISSDPMEQAKYYKDFGNPTDEDYEKAGCSKPFDLAPCCYDWCDEFEVRPPGDFPDGCEAPPSGYDCAPSSAPSATPTKSPTNPPTDPPTASPLPCPKWCGEISSDPMEQAEYYKENGNPRDEEYEAAGCSKPSDLAPCCYEWCDEFDVRPPGDFPDGCEAPPKGYDCAPSSAPSTPPTKIPTNPPTDPPTDPPTNAPTDHPTASPLPCPKWCGEISSDPMEQAEYYKENGNPTDEDYDEAGCSKPFDLAPCCYEWCDEFEVRPPGDFEFECEGPPPGYDCAPSSAPSESPTEKPTQATVTAPPTPEMSMSFRLLEEMFEE